MDRQRHRPHQHATSPAEPAQANKQVEPSDSPRGPAPRDEYSQPVVRRQNCGVQFSPDLRDRVADGTITLSYRLWSRSKVKVGGVYPSGSVMIEIDEIELLPFSSITDEDLARTGEPDVETLRRRAAHAGPIHDDTLLYRVEFHVVRRLDNTSR